MPYCPNCDGELDVWWDTPRTFECPCCRTSLQWFSDCTWDPESGEEYVWFEVEEVKQ